METSLIESTVQGAARPVALKITGRSVLRNTVWNLIGSAGPLLVAAAGIPTLLKGLGVERFAVLTLAWTLIGYLSIFDFGLGRALTKLIAEKLSLGEMDSIPGTFWDSMLLLLGMGCIAGIALGLSSSWIVSHVLHVPASIQLETVYAFRYMALAVPIVTVGTGLRGFLEAGQEFFQVNVVRTLMGILGVLGPVMVLPFSHRIDAAVISLALARAISAVVYFYLCVRHMPIIWTERGLSGKSVKPLLRFGGWLTLSNLLSPIMVSMDRFVISGLLAIGVVAYYVTPSEMMLKLLAIPAALQTVLFPAFSSSLCGDTSRAGLLYRKGNEATFLSIYPITIITVLFAKEILKIWLGQNFADHSYLILQLLSIGILINSIGHIPSILIQSAGRPDLSAKLKLIEIPPYVALTYWLIVRFGITGAAIAWVLRVLLDSILLFIVCRQWVPGKPFKVAHVSLALTSILIGFLLVKADVSILMRIAFGAASLLVAARWAYPLVRMGLQREKPAC
jgi:O-antigen/teichoic acid export membrane protein